MSKSESYTVREYRPGDEVQIVPLLRIAFPNYGLSSPLDYWRWYFQNPSSKGGIIVVAENYGRIIGCNQHFVLNIKVGSGVFTSAVANGLVVYPDFRKKGVFANTHKLLWVLTEKNNVKFVFAWTTNPILIKHTPSFVATSRKTFPFQVKHLMWIGDVGLHFRMKPRRSGFILRLGLETVRFFNKTTQNFRQECRSQQLLISEIPSFDARIDEFWEEVSTQYNFIIERTQNYLNWRYSDLMIGEHIIKLAEENGKIVGYSILSVDRTDKHYPFGQIVDLLALPGRLDVVDSLLADALKYFGSNGINICNATAVNGHPYSRVFKKRGFVNIKTKLRLFYVDNGIEKDIEKLATGPTSRVHICYGDVSL